MFLYLSTIWGQAYLVSDPNQHGSSWEHLAAALLSGFCVYFFAVEIINLIGAWVQ